MPLVNLREVLDWAKERNVAVPAFNIDNIDIAQSLMMAAEEERKPIILAVGQGAIRIGRLELLAGVVKTLAAGSSLPVVLHLDHGASFEQTLACIRAGFTSVMFDGSPLPLAENIAQSVLVVRAAHAVGVSVETELGAIPGVEDGIAHSGPAKVSLSDVETFIHAVDTDALAVSIGNAHGMYKTAPKLDIELLQKIRNLNAEVPHLVLHGGSGLGDGVIRTAVSNGIRKINVATEIRLAYLEGLHSAAGSQDIYTHIAAARNSIIEVARAKILLFTTKADERGNL